MQVQRTPSVTARGSDPASLRRPLFYRLASCPACDANGKPIAVICHGPWLLVSAGLVKGRHLTSYYTVQDDIRNAGGTWADRETVLDKTRKPDDIPAFNKAMLELFTGIQKKSKRAGQA